MIHELKEIVQSHLKNQKVAQKSVLATVVDLEGSSYRKPGVFMLIHEDGKITGAISGGCIEKEVVRQASSVFVDGIAKVITYDGRYRLGCEGILYILIESFSPNKSFFTAFDAAIKNRTSIGISSYYKKEISNNQSYGSVIELDGKKYPLQYDSNIDISLQKLERELTPCYRLIIIGAEHDAVQLCLFASNMGWEVIIVAHPAEEKKLSDFSGALELQNTVAETIDVSIIDAQTAVVLMTHSYAKDLQFLIALKECSPSYLGLLGPYKRREKLLNEFLEHCPEVDDSFFNVIYGPTGLDIGAETPQEITISILAEILAILRNRKVQSLRDKMKHLDY